jgi:hypothetical protein
MHDYEVRYLTKIGGVWETHTDVVTANTQSHALMIAGAKSFIQSCDWDAVKHISVSLISDKL